MDVNALAAVHDDPGDGFTLGSASLPMLPSCQDLPFPR